MVTPRDTQELVEAVRDVLTNAEHGYKREAKSNDFYEISVLEAQDALFALTELAERLAAAERSTPGRAALVEFELRVKAEAQVRELAKRLEAAERERDEYRDLWEGGRQNTNDAERDLASSQAAALLLHKRVEELERGLRDARRWGNDFQAQLAERDKQLEALRSALAAADEDSGQLERSLAERDKRIEGLKAAVRHVANLRPGWIDTETRKIARAALADPVVVPERAPADATPFEKPKMQTPGVVVPGWDDGTWKQEC